MLTSLKKIGMFMLKQVNNIYILMTLNFSICEGKCPPGWTLFFKANKCYKFFPGSRQFSSARRLCQENGGDVAIATELGENNFISFVFTDKNLWLGGERIGSTKNFGWNYRGTRVSDTSKFIPQQFLPWNPNEPNNGGAVGNENCIITNWFNNGRAKWNDVVCTFTAETVCERPANL